jgi:signal recognition particle subunit SRP54
MSDVVKSMSRNGGKGFARMAGALAGMGGGDMERLRAMGAGKLPPPGGLPGLGGPSNPSPGLPGLGGGFPFKKP